MSQNYSEDRVLSGNNNPHFVIFPTLQEIIIYLTRKLDQKSFILTFGQFDHLIILDNLI